ncbi:3-isopropylmalate/(R)-2-methylmalate dehydratase small subunit [Thermostichus sp. MS-CIW-21]|jgi:3-isopropylmalate/(R)-2-methylmalate dehydratase small subunit|uniref:3-isopropylmalate dehydratase small subunit n=1 Tax=unclassified Synechococcus TaxID=2626047 RepID=UPI0002F31B02|nr:MULTISPECIES: 3-isopropylmalate dehydratase small subunit [unclassified Synechococcus]PIK86802.1 isopropylmalate isomerase [Synechococcus sp. 63AY4M2]PIK87715.1 isopropylmalate isomerase [Synechococcus sp. 65AY6A5]PIK92158.1 isopropylmalate isomerase [Synechococcus sp. 65AY6Li]PIK95871.1 isopropylmalate isomerase [Synechococcus sp. 60AY4M2]PIK98110.1 isopropylmalate isomerase [Synechococcus sp. 63AY4M1]
MPSEVLTITGRGIPLVGNDIDTDRIIPARFLKCVTFEGLGQHVFADDRAQNPGQHPFDLPQYQGAEILLVNANFGCGSSREHAPQALAKWGIRALVGESFAEIFFGNCLALGIPCVTAPASVIQTLQGAVAENPQLRLTLDVLNKQVCWEDRTAAVEIPQGAWQMLVQGTWDATGQLLAARERIQEVAASLPYLRWQRVR